MSGMVNPFLLLTAFGWGLGRRFSMEGVTYLQFIVPGIVVLSAMNISFSAVGIPLNLSRRYTKTLEEYLVAPISTSSIVLGKVLYGMVRGFISSFIIVLLGLIYGAEISVNLVGILTIALTCFLFSSLGVWAAMTLWSHEDMSNFSTVVLMPMAFLSGTFFSLENMPGWISRPLLLLPLTHSSLCLRAAMLGRDLPVLSFFALFSYSAIFFYLALRSFRRGDIT
jgi:ABC-type multidrug transport system permease subunit